MALRRYAKAPLLRSGQHFGTSEAYRIIRERVVSGEIKTDVHVLQQGERLDIIAGQRYGDGRLWWVIAAASGIGWGLQVPPGTRLDIPVDLQLVSQVVG